MRVKTKDIPASGRTISFDLPLEALNERIASAQLSCADATPCVFLSPVHSEIKLRLEGSTVFLSGSASGCYMTNCSRCAEESQQEISCELEIALQPRDENSPEGDDAEDISYGHYSNKEIACAEIVEEFLVLKLPYAVLCAENCKGLCTNCGQNLNIAECACMEEKVLDPRLAALQSLKIKH